MPGGVKERPAWVAARGLWYEALERWPRAYCMYLRRRPVNTVVTPTTSIVLEGFPGSANSFAREAFLYSNPDALVASHIHTSAHLLEALRLGRPTVLPLRAPVDAIASLLARGYPVGAAGAFRAYERLHRRLLPNLDRVVVAPFERITKRFGEVIEEVNVRFGAELVPFPHDDPNARDAVVARLEAYSREVAGTGDAGSLLQATPTNARRERTAEVRAELLDSTYDDLRRRCETLYDTTLSRPSPSRSVVSAGGSLNWSRGVALPSPP